eukprot:SAG31_NODE_1518_length_8029_cov_43.028247_6_plen_71_part_00
MSQLRARIRKVLVVVLDELLRKKVAGFMDVVQHKKLQHSWRVEHRSARDGMSQIEKFKTEQEQFEERQSL